MDTSTTPRNLLRTMFDAAIEAAQPAHCLTGFLPEPPKGRLIVIGAGKASAAMARAFEDAWSGPLSGVIKPKPFSSLNHLTVPVAIILYIQKKLKGDQPLVGGENQESEAKNREVVCRNAGSNRRITTRT